MSKSKPTVPVTWDSKSAGNKSKRRKQTMKYVKSDSERIILVSRSNLNSWIEQGLRSLGELKDATTPVNIKIGDDNKIGLVPITISLKTEKKGVLIEH